MGYVRGIILFIAVTALPVFLFVMTAGINLIRAWTKKTLRLLSSARLQLPPSKYVQKQVGKLGGVGLSWCERVFVEDEGLLSYFCLCLLVLIPKNYMGEIAYHVVRFARSWDICD